MKTPHFYSVDLLHPHYIKGFKFFSTKEEAEKYKDEQELIYRRIKLSEPIPLYTGKVPDGYMLVKKQSLFERLLSMKVRLIM